MGCVQQRDFLLRVVFAHSALQDQYFFTRHMALIEGD